MMMKRQSEQVVAIDVGTSKVCVLVGRKTEYSLDVIGIGLHESRGLRKGQVVDIDATSECIRLAVEEAELMASCEISSVVVGVSAGHIRSNDGHGMVNIPSSEVSAADVERVLDAAKMPGPAPGQLLLHTLVQDFAVDGQEGVRDPVGMSGARLETRVHLVTASSAAVQNVVKGCMRCGLHVEGVALETLASGRTVLNAEERELGVVLVDIGGGTTDVAIWHRGSLVHTASIALGGDIVSRDVGVGLRTTMQAAERLKEFHGCALTDAVDPRELIEVPSSGGNRAHRKSRRLLAAIIEPRMEEILRYVRREVECSGYVDAVRAGYVLTGGTMAMPGTLDLAERVLAMSVRCGVPTGIGGLVDVVRQPKYAVAVGLLQHAASQPNSRELYQLRQRSLSGRMRSGFWDILQRLL